MPARFQRIQAVITTAQTLLDCLQEAKSHDSAVIPPRDDHAAREKLVQRALSRAEARAVKIVDEIRTIRDMEKE